MTRNETPPASYSDPTGPAALVRLWESRDPGEWAADSRHYADAGSKAIQFGQQALAYDILSEGKSLFTEESRIAFLAALSAANLGSMARASAILDGVVPKLSKMDSLFSEALSLRGRIEKERWARAPETTAGRAALTDAAAFYLQAYEASAEVFPGINAASMHFLAGQKDRALDLAESVLESCLREEEQDGVQTTWIQATMGEAHLLAGRQEESAGHYAAAAELAGSRLGQIASMRRQVNRLARATEVDAAVLEALNVGRVVVFTGHMIDEQGRPSPRFPPELADTVRREMEEALESLKARVGYSSLASGGDILFCEAMQQRRGEANVILPFSEDAFVETSVAPAGEDWVARFRKAKDGRNTLTREAVMGGHDGDAVLFEYCAHLLQGEAILRAQRLETEAVLLALLDPSSETGPGGTLATLEEWRSFGYPLRIIDLEACRHGAHIETAADGTLSRGAPQPHARQGSHQRRVHTCLFTDMVGFGGLRDSEIPAFFEHYLGKVAFALRESGHEPEFFNTWGDGIFLVFRDPTAAGEFALLLRDIVRDTDWLRIGLPQDTDIRLALHTGPVFQAWDAVLERKNFFGEHVTRAARLEPATARGSVFVTEETAAFLSLAPSSQLACDYLGEVVLPKETGAKRVYRLRRGTELE
jgi:class 3 adenylate cyclase